MEGCLLKRVQIEDFQGAFFNCICKYEQTMNKRKTFVDTTVQRQFYIMLREVKHILFLYSVSRRGVRIQSS